MIELLLVVLLQVPAAAPCALPVYMADGSQRCAVSPASIAFGRIVWHDRETGRILQVPADQVQLDRTRAVHEAARAKTPAGGEVSFVGTWRPLQPAGHAHHDSVLQIVVLPASAAPAAPRATRRSWTGRERFNLMVARADWEETAAWRWAGVAYQLNRLDQAERPSETFLRTWFALESIESARAAQARADALNEALRPRSR